MSPEQNVTVPPLPSPLLCARRTFLASLILAAKLFDDRAYSCKAWATFTGMATREVVRCEHVLFAAMESRLWQEKALEPIEGLHTQPVIGIHDVFVAEADIQPVLQQRTTPSQDSLLDLLYAAWLVDVSSSSSTSMEDAEVSGISVCSKWLDADAPSYPGPSSSSTLSSYEAIMVADDTFRRLRDQDNLSGTTFLLDGAAHGTKATLARALAS